MDPPQVWPNSDYNHRLTTSHQWLDTATLLSHSSWVLYSLHVRCSPIRSRQVSSFVPVPSDLLKLMSGISAKLSSCGECCAPRAPRYKTTGGGILARSSTSSDTAESSKPSSSPQLYIRRHRYHSSLPCSSALMSACTLAYVYSRHS